MAITEQTVIEDFWDYSKKIMTREEVDFLWASLKGLSEQENASDATYQKTLDNISKVTTALSALGITKGYYRAFQPNRAVPTTANPRTEMLKLAANTIVLLVSGAIQNHINRYDFGARIEHGFQGISKVRQAMITNNMNAVEIYHSAYAKVVERRTGIVHGYYLQAQPLFKRYWVNGIEYTLES